MHNSKNSSRNSKHKHKPKHQQLTETLSSARADGAWPSVQTEQLLGDLLVQLDAVTFPACPGPVGVLATLVQRVVHLLRVVELLKVLRRARLEAQQLFGQHGGACSVFEFLCGVFWRSFFGGVFLAEILGRDIYFWVCVFLAFFFFACLFLYEIYTKPNYL